MKQRKRVDQVIRDEAIKIFQGVRGKVSNEDMARMLHVSLRRVSQLKKEYQQTGTIKITYKNQHSDLFQKRKLEETEEIKKIRREFPLATLNEICERMLEKGYFVSTSTVSARLEEKHETNKVEPQQQNGDAVLEAFRQFREKFKEINKGSSIDPQISVDFLSAAHDKSVEEENVRISVLPKEEYKQIKGKQPSNVKKTQSKEKMIHADQSCRKIPHPQGSFSRKPIHPYRFSQIQTGELLTKALKYRKIAQQAHFLSKKAQEELQRRIQYHANPVQLEYYPQNIENIQETFIYEEFAHDELFHLI